jgi:diacylglycerol O-acyltransferase
MKRDAAATAERLSAEDARILELESGTVRGHTCKVIVIGGRHSAEAVRTHLSGRLDAVRRLRQRVEQASGGPVWVDDPTF